MKITNSSELKKFNDLQVFVRDGMPESWLELAEEFTIAAEALWSVHDKGFRLESEDVVEAGGQIVSEVKQAVMVSRPYILLAGFAIENLLKGLLIAKNPSLLARGLIPKEINSHKILTLATKVEGLELSREEEHLCQIFQDAIPYWGRYPIPLRSTGIKPEVALDENFREVFLSLEYRLGKILYEMIRDGWNSGVGPSHGEVYYAKYETEQEDGGDVRLAS